MIFPCRLMQDNQKAIGPTCFYCRPSLHWEQSFGGFQRSLENGSPTKQLPGLIFIPVFTMACSDFLAWSGGWSGSLFSGLQVKKCFGCWCLCHQHFVLSHWNGLIGTPGKRPCSIFNPCSKKTQHSLSKWNSWEKKSYLFRWKLFWCQNTIR